MPEARQSELTHVREIVPGVFLDLWQAAGRCMGCNDLIRGGYCREEAKRRTLPGQAFANRVPIDTIRVCPRGRGIDRNTEAVVD